MATIAIRAIGHTNTTQLNVEDGIISERQALYACKRLGVPKGSALEIVNMPKDYPYADVSIHTDSGAMISICEAGYKPPTHAEYRAKKDRVQPKRGFLSRLFWAVEKALR